MSGADGVTLWGLTAPLLSIPEMYAATQEASQKTPGPAPLIRDLSSDTFLLQADLLMLLGSKARGVKKRYPLGDHLTVRMSDLDLVKCE